MLIIMNGVSGVNIKLRNIIEKRLQLHATCLIFYFITSHPVAAVAIQ
jgi:hypothetical protein